MLAGTVPVPRGCGEKHGTGMVPAEFNKPKAGTPMCRCFVIVAATLLCFSAAAVGEDVGEDVGEVAVETAQRITFPLSVIGPEPADITPPSAAEVHEAIRRGVAFLLESQLKQGAWGRSANSKYYRIWAPVPGAHDAFRTATTSLCVMALVEARQLFEGELREQMEQAIDRGQAWLLEHADDLRRSEPDAADDYFGYALYNVWGHSFAIHAIVRLHERASGDARLQAKLRNLLEYQVDRLRRDEYLNGGWGYYDEAFSDKYGRNLRPRRARMQRPTGSPISFTTATALIALKEAAALGVEFPEAALQRAIASIHRQRYPDFAYAYGEYLRYSPRAGINRPAGSLGRSQVCNLALRLYDDPLVTDDVLKTWLKRLIARNGWLSMSRKRHIPGQSPHFADFGVAGYFYYYGHFYATMCFEQLPEQEWPYYQAHVAHLLLPLQEKDGSWWDYILYDYHQQYGTAMAISSLVRCSQSPSSATE